jgi:hypothetical protein
MHRLGTRVRAYQGLGTEGGAVRFLDKAVRRGDGAPHAGAERPGAEQRLGVAAKGFELQPRVNHAPHVTHLLRNRIGGLEFVVTGKHAV